MAASNEQGRYITRDEVIEFLQETIRQFLTFKFKGEIPDWFELLMTRLIEGIEDIVGDAMPARLCDQCQYYHQCIMYETAKLEWINCAWALARVCPNFVHRNTSVGASRN